MWLKRQWMAGLAMGLAVSTAPGCGFENSCEHICDIGVADCTGTDRGPCIDSCKEAIGEDENRRQQCADCVARACLNEDTSNRCQSSTSSWCTTLDVECSSTCGFF